MGKENPLKGIDLFEGLGDEQLEAIRAVAEPREYDIGQTVFEEGDAGTHLYCVVDGRAEISVALAGASEQAPVHVAVPGTVFGEFVLFDRGQRSATVRAVKRLSILALSADGLERLFAADPACGYRVMHNLCRVLIERVNKTTRELRSSLMW